MDRDESSVGHRARGDGGNEEGLDQDTIVYQRPRGWSGRETRERGSGPKYPVLPSRVRTSTPTPYTPQSVSVVVVVERDTRR